MDTKVSPAQQPNEEYIVCLDEHVERFPDRFPAVFCGQKLDGATGIHNHTIYRDSDIDLSRKRSDYKDDPEEVDRIYLKHDPDKTGDRSDHSATIYLIRRKTQSTYSTNVSGETVMTNYPIADYPPKTIFGKRINDLKEDKERVANYVVNKFIMEGSSVFIGDGSSTFYAGIGLFKKRNQVTIWTNHLAIATEYSLSPLIPHTELYLAGGEVDQDLMMTCDKIQDSDIRQWSSQAQCIILSVHCLFADEGPAGMEQKSLSIKHNAIQGALSNGADIIFIADHDKLSQQYNKQPLVFPSDRDWEEIMKNKNVYIVTSRPTDKNYVRKFVENPTNALECFQHNDWILNVSMNEGDTHKKKDRYILV